MASRHLLPRNTSFVPTDNRVGTPVSHGAISSSSRLRTSTTVKWSRARRRSARAIAFSEFFSFPHTYRTSQRRWGRHSARDAAMLRWASRVGGAVVVDDPPPLCRNINCSCRRLNPRSLENILARGPSFVDKKKNWAGLETRAPPLPTLARLGRGLPCLSPSSSSGASGRCLVRVLVAAKVVVELRVVRLLVGLFAHLFSEAGKAARVVVQVRVQHGCGSRGGFCPVRSLWRHRLRLRLLVGKLSRRSVVLLKADCVRR